jgi:hypothetical protein
VHYRDGAQIFEERTLWTIAVFSMLAFAARRADAGVAPPPLAPDDGNTFDVYVAGQEQYDSNIYRLPPGVNAATVVAPDATKADSITTASLGGDGQWVGGRQVVELNLRADENLFAHNTVLNNTSGYGNLLWNWQVGPHLSGDASVEYNHALASFAESRYLGRDIADTTQYNADARYQFTPRWTVFGGFNDFNVTHSLAAAQYNDFHQKTGDVGLELATGVNDTFSVEYRYTEASFPPSNLVTVNDVSFVPDYHEDLPEFLFKYALTEKTQISGYVGDRKRTFDNSALSGFSKVVGRLELTWVPTEKTNVVFAGWHEVHAYLVSEANYFISNGGSIHPIWNATEKIRVAFLVSYEHQDFISDSVTVIQQGPLNANITTEQASVIYSPRSSWIFSLVFNHQKRDSNQLSYQFGDDLATASVLYKIH